MHYAYCDTRAENCKLSERRISATQGVKRVAVVQRMPLLGDMRLAYCVMRVEAREGAATPNVSILMYCETGSEAYQLFVNCTTKAGSVILWTCMADVLHTAKVGMRTVQ